jgi:hypothetical protein
VGSVRCRWEWRAAASDEGEATVAVPVDEVAAAAGVSSGPSMHLHHSGLLQVGQETAATPMVVTCTQQVVSLSRLRSK